MKAKVDYLNNPNKVNLYEVVPLSTPFIVCVEPTSFCNLKCEFCPNTKVDNKLKQMMPMETFEKIVHDLKAFPAPTKVFKFCGNGESFLNKNMPEMIKMVHNNKIAERIEIISNGTLLTPEINRKIVAAGLNTLKISIEALDEEGYEKIAKAKIDVEQLRHNLEDLYNHKGDNLTLYIKINNLALNGKEDEQKFYDTYGDICDAIFIEGISHIFPNFEIENERVNESRYGGQCVIRRKVCAQAFKTLNIAANGDISPCSVDWAHKVVMGNVRENTLPEIWNGEKFTTLRKRFLRGEVDDIEACCDCGNYYLSDPDDLDDHCETILQRMERE